jgi:hypothetical protein
MFPFVFLHISLVCANVPYLGLGVPFACRVACYDSLYGLSCFTLCLLYWNWRSLLAFPFLGDAASLESVPDLVKAMYLNIESFPCVRLLNLSSEIGCSSESPLASLLLANAWIPKTIFLCHHYKLTSLESPYAVRSWQWKDHCTNCKI